MSNYYKYEKYQKYINGVPADPPVYQRGELIGIEEYDSIADCEKAAIYEWRVSSESDYICDGYSSYYKEYKYKSTDKGQTWTRTSQSRKGALKSQYATECGWSLQERWTSTGVTRCSGGDLLEEFIKEISYDMGNTWIVSQPAKYKYEVKEKWYKDCVLQLAPLEFEVTTEEPNVPIWIEISVRGRDRYQYFINWGESENIAEYPFYYPSYYIMTDNRYSSYPGAPFSYTYANAGTYTIKLWVNNIDIIGGVWRSITQQNPSNPTHMTQFKYTDKYTYKIKSFGNLPNSYLEGINLSGTPLTELCSDEYGFLGGENFTKGIQIASLTSHPENVTHYRYDVYHGYDGSADYTKGTLIGQAFDVANTKLTTIPQGLFKYATYMGGVRFANCRIQSIPEDLFVNCVGLQSCIEAFRETDITDIPEGLFDNCPNLSYAQIAFTNTGITTVSRLWNISSSINTDRMFYNCKSLVSIADNFGQLTGNKVSMFENCTELTSLGGLTLGRGTMDSMLANTKISEFPTNVWSNVSNGDSAVEMFRDCKELKAVSGVIKGPTMGSVQRMFCNSGLTYVDIQFPDLFYSRDALVEMFAYCKELNTVNNNMFNKDAESLYPTRMFMGCVSLTEWIKDGDTNIWDYPAFYEADNQPHHLQYTYMYIGCTQIMEQIPVEFGGLIGNNITLYPTIITVSPKGGNESYINLIFTGALTDKYTSSFYFIDWGDGTSDFNPASHTYKTSDAYTMKIYTNSYQWKEFNDGVGCNYRIENWGTCIPNFSSNSKDSNATCTYWGEDQYGVMRTITDIKQLGSSDYIQEVHPDLLKYAENLNGVNLRFKSILVIPPKFFNTCPKLTQIALVYENMVLESVDGLFEDYSGDTSMSSIITFSTMPRTMNRMFKNSQGLSGNWRMFYQNTWDKLEEAEECFMNSTYTNLEIIKASSLRKAARMYKGSIVTSDNAQYIYSQNIDMTECFADAKMDVGILFSKEQDDYSVNLTSAFNNCAELTNLPKVNYKSKIYNLWEIEGIIGTGCFKGCTKLLEQYGDIIPDDWK